MAWERARPPSEESVLRLDNCGKHRLARRATPPSDGRVSLRLVYSLRREAVNVREEATSL
jgi:hypothetical protein